MTYVINAKKESEEIMSKAQTDSANMLESARDRSNEMLTSAQENRDKTLKAVNDYTNDILNSMSTSLETCLSDVKSIQKKMSSVSVTKGNNKNYNFKK